MPPIYLKVWHLLLGEVAHRGNSEKRNLPPGTMTTTLWWLQERLEWRENRGVRKPCLAAISNILKWMQQQKMIEYTTHRNRFTRITICNWSTYQAAEWPPVETEYGPERPMKPGSDPETPTHKNQIETEPPLDQGTYNTSPVELIETPPTGVNQIETERRKKTTTYRGPRDEPVETGTSLFNNVQELGTKSIDCEDAEQLPKERKHDPYIDRMVEHWKELTGQDGAKAAGFFARLRKTYGEELVESKVGELVLRGIKLTKDERGTPEGYVIAVLKNAQAERKAAPTSPVSTREEEWEPPARYRKPANQGG